MTNQPKDVMFEYRQSTINETKHRVLLQDIINPLLIASLAILASLAITGLCFVLPTYLIAITVILFILVLVLLAIKRRLKQMIRKELVIQDNLMLKMNTADIARNQ